MAACSVEFWPSLERNFSGIGCTLEAKTTVSNSTQCYLFIGNFSKKYTVSELTFSFKKNKLTSPFPQQSALHFALFFLL